MADAGARRHDAEIRKSLLTPTQERIALHVALIFDGDILLERILEAEIVDHYRMVDDEIDFGERIDFFGIAAERLHRIAHRGEIDDRGHAGEVLHQHARRTKSNFTGGSSLGRPFRQRADVVGAHRLSVLVPQQIFEQDLQRIGQLGNAFQAVLFRRRQAEIDIGLAARRQRAAGFESVEARAHETALAWSWNRLWFRGVSRERKVSFRLRLGFGGHCDLISPAVASA